MDGAIDYRAYSNQELVQALQTIDRIRFPQNFANLTLELDRRKVPGSSPAPISPTVAHKAIWPAGPAVGADVIVHPISLWKYVVLFALIFYVGAIVLGTVVEYFELKRSSSLGNVLIFFSAMIVGDRFVHRHRRLFYAREAHRLMLYCLLAILPLEAIALIGNPELLEKLSVAVAFIALPMTVGLNVLSVWIAYRFLARTSMLRKLKKLGLNAA